MILGEEKVKKWDKSKESGDRMTEVVKKDALGAPETKSKNRLKIRWETPELLKK